MVDLTSGMYAAIAVLAALMMKEREGAGTYLDVSMFDTMITWMSVRAGNFLVYGKTPQNEHLSPLNTVFETKDGKNISLGLVEEHFWRKFLVAADEQKLLKDERFASAAGRKEHGSELFEILKKIVAKRTSQEWEGILDWRKVPYAKVYSIDETINDPHLQARNIFSEIDVEGLGRIREVLFPVQFSGSRLEIRLPPPKWGEHVDEILKRLGYSKKKIAKLREEGAI
jgi:crotonobetainyl-CoA:carnitine CoA-transferase CaiB-like acyl-CoA transferase